MRKHLRLALCGMAAVVLAGCVIIGDRLDQFRTRFLTVPFFVFDNAPGYKKPPQAPVMEDDTNLVVAISGGGVRSSVFASGVLEQLACMKDPRNPSRSLLERVDAICAVSGGSVAAAYYGLYKPNSFSNPQTTAQFFQQFKSNMTLDIFMRGWAHYVSHPWEGAGRYYSRYRFVQSLANTYDQHMFKGATFAQLAQREAAGESPAVILYSASLDSGKKFLFTNLNVCDKFNVNPSKLIGELPGSVPESDVAGMTMLAQIAGSQIYSSFGFDSIDSDICSFHISSAIAASSAQPVLPGPATLIDYKTNGYVHLADGGINDNFGIDALVEMYLAKLQRGGKHKKLVVISIDSASKTPGRGKVGDPDGYMGALSYGNQAFSSLTARGQTFASVVYGSLSSIKVVPLQLWEAPNLSTLSDRAFGGSISETDMYKVLGAAATVTQKHAGDIKAAFGE
ncbi:MAG: patatin-like phospholipase family protein [Candidatus Sumerlaeaceae bacterium]|nr:patatin-like phospholipase family protein [Candidatus Sumerlaeaceae bacterium]